MSIRTIPLRKLLQLMYAAPNLRTAKLRGDIRDDRDRERGDEAGGPDFFSPFWKSAKNHVFGGEDLHTAVDRHIAANSRRRNLYPQLRDGFLLWWNERRRWTNEPFRQGVAPKGAYVHAALGATIRIGSVMAVRDGRNDDHFIYPYFSAAPALPEEGARLGLWIMGQTLTQVPRSELRLLDVIRGDNFSLDRNPLRGDENSVFEDRYRRLIREWETLREEYE